MHLTGKQFTLSKRNPELKNWQKMIMKWMYIYGTNVIMEYDRFWSCCIWQWTSNCCNFKELLIIKLGTKVFFMSNNCKQSNANSAGDDHVKRWVTHVSILTVKKMDEILLTLCPRQKPSHVLQWLELDAYLQACFID